ncbi:MAG TPA: sugar phosphate nucleotidyltransferase [Chthoniobacterales bacterium]|nr:sugar phosphate nucleotidyltransferase [Chthoniobacterales bacterium]
MITQAFVLAAGLGTRLRPLTDELPKPLVPIFQKPLITFALDHLIATGIRRFVVNTHRLPHLFERQFAEKNYRGRPLDLVNEPELLETGGGIKNAEPLLREGDFLTYSGDILTDIPLSSLIEEHFRAGNDVTLALRETGFKPSIAFLDGRIVDIGERFGIAGDYDFANIAVWSRKIFQRIPQRKISFIPVLLDWIKEGGKIGGVILNEGKWLNIGSSAQYVEAHRMIASENWSPDFVCGADWRARIAKSATIDATAQLRGLTVVGADCYVGAEAVVQDTIVWPGAQIASLSELQSCIVRARQRAAGILKNAIV